MIEVYKLISLKHSQLKELQVLRGLNTKCIRYGTTDIN